MLGRRTVWSVCGFLPVLAAAVAGQAQQLTRSQQQLLQERVIPAYHSGAAVPLFEAAVELTSRQSETRLAAMDSLLESQQLPALGPMLLEALVKHVENGGHVDNGGRVTGLKTTPEVVLIIRSAHADRLVALQAELKDLQASPVDSNPPGDFAAFEAQGRRLEQTQLRLANATQTTKLVSSLRAGRIRSTSESMHALRQEQQALDAVARRVVERRLELLLQRLAYSVAILRDSEDVKQRLVAAHFVNVDGTLLQQTFPAAGANQGQNEYENERLNDPELPAKVREQVEQGTMLAGELLPKARNLFAGIHWWLRGRYGRGPDFYGLIKSELVSQSADARYPLYMPYELPKEDKPASGGPDYPDRRHYYTWQWETRQLHYRQSRSSIRLPDPNKQGEPKQAPVKVTQKPARLHSLRGRGGGTGIGLSSGSMFVVSIPPSIWLGMKRNPDYMNRVLYRNTPPYKPDQGYNKPSGYQPPSAVERVYTETYIPNQDPNAIHRLVGYLEYSLALYYLDTLAESCRPDELAAVDELIKERPELTVETNLSRTVENGNSSLSEQPQAAGDDFRRRGLAWVTGLARSELAAMLVGFANGDDALLRLASPRDGDAYRELVMDGMRTHYWSLTQDPDLPRVLKGDADVPTTLAYMRRLLVAEGFLKSVATALRDELSPAQKSELRVWKTNLDKLQEVLAARIEDFHQVDVEDRAR